MRGSQVGWGVSAIRKKREEKVKGEELCVWKTQRKLLLNTLNLFSFFVVVVLFFELKSALGKGLEARSCWDLPSVPQAVVPLNSWAFHIN